MCVLCNDIRVIDNIYSGPLQHNKAEESVHSHCVSGQTAQLLTFPPVRITSRTMHAIQELAGLDSVIEIFYVMGT